ncbi:hypothetical protein OUZ56_008784 [Daphnia magna]|uniref:Uncharacterized protein n=1 Tax=Daphnia magna TaxID=35525 RepID=A0ABR0AEF7_9CRUS|nr:hypothetical protein OUZ56_008784 [Daphnia magna]
MVSFLRLRNHDCCYFSRPAGAIYIQLKTRDEKDFKPLMDTLRHFHGAGGRCGCHIAYCTCTQAAATYLISPSDAPCLTPFTWAQTHLCVKLSSMMTSIQVPIKRLYKEEYRDHRLLKYVSPFFFSSSSQADLTDSTALQAANNGPE